MRNIFPKWRIWINVWIDLKSAHWSISDQVQYCYEVTFCQCVSKFQISWHGLSDLCLIRYIQQVLELRGFELHDFEQREFLERFKAFWTIKSSSYTILRSRSSRKIALLKTNDLTYMVLVLSYMEFPLFQKSCSSRSPCNIVTKITFCQCVSKFQISWNHGLSDIWLV